MTDIAVPNGFDLPVAAAPRAGVLDAPLPARVAVRPGDLDGLRPLLRVEVGQEVAAGAPLVTSRDDPRVALCSPAPGRVEAVLRGPRRAVAAVVVAVDGGVAAEQDGCGSLAVAASAGELVDALLASGLWPLLRRWPLGGIADPSVRPSAIFVSALRDDPCEPDPEWVLPRAADDFALGLERLAGLTTGALYLGVDGLRPTPAWAARGEVRRFTGRYPRGNPAVQAYWTDRPRRGEVAWLLDWQAALAIGRSLRRGRPSFERVVATAGPGFLAPAAYRTLQGAALAALPGARADGPLRLVAGGLLTGRRVEPDGFLGFHDAVAYALPEVGARRLLGFLRPGLDRRSRSRSFLSTLLRAAASLPLTTARHGGPRAFVVTDVYRDVCPVEVWPDHLAKALLVGDLDAAEAHGLLDCAHCGLCAFVCPSKVEVAEVLREGAAALRREAAHG